MITLPNEDIRRVVIPRLRSNFDCRPFGGDRLAVMLRVSGYLTHALGRDRAIYIGVLFLLVSGLARSRSFRIPRLGACSGASVVSGRGYFFSGSCLDSSQARLQVTN